MPSVTTPITALLAVVVSLGSASADEPDYNRDIKPLLSENCFFCHGPDAADRKADLRLDTAEGAAEVLDSGELLARILSSDPDEMMPPPEAKISLTDAEKDLLRAWVEAGAPYAEHWAFVPPARSEVGQGEHPVDAIVGRHHAAAGVEPLPRADAAIQVRRVTLDLTGLPPTPEEVAAFVADPSDAAYAALVDRLLASPRYGERMAWEWLDAARYADSNGYQGDNERTMWPWRDWAVRAFNENLPYDAFTIYQIAGDLLPEATFEQRLATGFLRNHPINGEGGRIAEENRVEYVFDMTETVGTVWMGLTLNCCRCHDHKFDPVSQREYYQLSAFFNQTPVDGGGGNPQTPPVLAAPSPGQRAELESVAAELEEARSDAAARRRALASGAEPDAPPLTWRPLVPQTLRSANGQTLTVQADGAVLAAGENPAKDTYTLRFPLAAGGALAALRLDALMHPSMTGGGLARSNSGNFVLTEIEVSVESGGAARRLEIGSAAATYEQGGLAVTKAFDGDPDSGWAVHEGRTVDRPHAAVFRFREAAEVGAGAVLSVVLRHDSKHESHHLGHFRVSVSPDPEATLEDSPEDRVLAELEARVAELGKRRSDIEKAAPKVMVMADRPKLRPTYVLDTGIYSKRGEEVAMGTPAVLPPLGVAEGAGPDRLALARWLVADAHPLTARVAVNRYWQMLFGIGLVKTAEDFGVQGEVPPMGDLLDHLAVEFRESGWDVKALLRSIVTSDAYRRSARGGDFAGDPENRLLARGPRFRMPSWMIRDSALASSGLLVEQVGGAPVNPYQPEGIWEEASFGNKRYRRDGGDALYRRSLYTFWRRIVAPPAFFDNAGRVVCSVKPFRTNTPLHALYTFNDVTFVESARALAGELLNSGPEADRDVLDSAFRRVVGRPASGGEASVLLGQLRRSRATFEADPAAAEAFLAVGEQERDPALAPAELAAWTSLCLAVYNLDESLTKE